MNDEEARSWLSGRNVPRETLRAIEYFLDLLRAEAEQQNLIAASTMTSIWSRHVVDSAQLLDHVRGDWRSWLDLGSGAGFPGIVVALISGRQTTLIESRAKRIVFLRSVVNALALDDRVEIVGARVETAPQRSHDVISARAFAPLPKLLALAAPFATRATQWVLPKGRGAREELEAALGSWQGRFTLVPSITDAESSIIVADGVQPRKAGR